MAFSIEGTATLDGVGVEGAEVFCIDDSGNSILGSAVTDVDGNYEISLDDETTAHLTIQYEDPDTGDLYNSKSKPFVVVESDVPLIDSFEHNDLSSFYVGVTDRFDITSNFATDGSLGLEMAGNPQGSIRSYPGDGLDNYPSRGDVFEFDWQTSATNDDVDNSHRTYIYFALDESVDNYYRLDLDVLNDAFSLWQIADSGNDRFGVSFGVGYPSNTHLSVEVDFDSGADGTVAAELRNEDTNTVLESISGTNTFRDTGGIGYYAETGIDEKMFADFFRITNP